MPKKEKVYSEKIRVKVKPSQKEKAIDIGKGNVSKGVRKAIDDFKEKKK